MISSDLLPNGSEQSRHPVDVDGREVVYPHHKNQFFNVEFTYIVTSELCLLKFVYIQQNSLNGSFPRLQKWEVASPCRPAPTAHANSFTCGSPALPNANFPKSA
jgi:hypothetical protein